MLKKIKDVCILEKITSIVEKIKKDEPNFVNGKDMLNYCSYFSCLLMKEFFQAGISSKNITISISSEHLPKNSIVKSKGLCNHNVVLVDNYIIDFTYLQFGDLVNKVIMKEKDYFKNPWTINKVTKDTELNLSGL